MRVIQPSDRHAPSGLRALAAAGLATLLASTCCLGPLVLVTLGVSGAWISMLSVLGPYQPYLMGVALIALLLAGKRIWRPAAPCAPGETCALAPVRRVYQMVFVAICILLLAALVFPFVAPWFY